MSDHPAGDEVNIAGLYREHNGKVLAALIRAVGNFSLAEDALQDAWISASGSWKNNNIPRSPEAWLYKVARRRAIDEIRKHQTRHRYADQIAYLEQLQQSPEIYVEDIPDERLRLAFTCCHPALKQEHQIALTLHAICGLTTEEIAKAFLLGTSTLAQRLVRAKRKIQDAGIPYHIPDKDQLPERLASVRSVIYLLFNEGYNAHSEGPMIRDELCTEGIRLGLLLQEQLPDAESAGLLALMQLHDSRRPARLSPTGAFVSLEEQDRKLWNVQQAHDAKSLLLRTLAKGDPGPYQIQAAISAVHNDAKSYDDTDWQQIVGLYEALLKYGDSPVIKLNQALAIAELGELNESLAIISSIESSLVDYQSFHAAKASLMQRSGNVVEAKKSYQTAINLSTNDAEREFLLAQLESYKQ